MQLTAVLAFGLLGAASAIPAPAHLSVLDKRQAAVITGALTPIKTALTDLGTSIQAIAGTDIPKETADVTAKSKAVADALNAGTKTVTGAQPVGLTEALTVQSASQDLTKLTASTIDALIGKKDIIVKGNQAKTVVDNLTMQKTASDAFIKAVVSKVPEGLQGIAGSLTKSVGESLQKGITAFS